MPVRLLEADSDPLEVAQKLADAHPGLLAPHIVCVEQLQRLVVEKQARLRFICIFAQRAFRISK